MTEVLTTARALSKFWDELVGEGFDEEFADLLTQIAAERILSAEGLIVTEPDDDPDPDIPEVGTVSLRVVPDLSQVRAFLDAA